MSDQTPTEEQDQSPYTDEQFPAEYRATWAALVEGINRLANEVFRDMPNAHLILGAQWGEMGESDSGLLPCILTSDLGPCKTLSALDDLRTFAHSEHHAYHGWPAPEGEQIDHTSTVEGFMPITEADVPEDIRQFAENLVSGLGLSLEDVEVRHFSAVTTSDLSQAPEYVEGANTAEAEQKFESGSESEG